MVNGGTPNHLNQMNITKDKGDGHGLAASEGGHAVPENQRNGSSPVSKVVRKFLRDFPEREKPTLDESARIKELKRQAALLRASKEERGEFP